MRATHLRRFLALSAACLSLSACAQGLEPAPTAETVPYDPAIRADVEQQVAQSGARSANALETLAMIQRARTAPAAPTMDESKLPPELRRKATIEFTGPAIEVSRNLAASIGYGFIETGNPPASPGLVTVNDHDVSVAKALEDVGLQAQRFATVIVDPNMKRVEFRNETVEGSAPRAARSAAPHYARHHVRHRCVTHVRTACIAQPSS